MTAKTKSLRYDGAGSLTYRDAAGVRHTAQRGIPFEADADTAELLASTPDLVELDAEGDVANDSPTSEEAAAIDYSSMSSKQLKALAKSRKLSQAGKSADIAARLAADDAEQAAAAAAAQPHPSSSEAEAGAAAPPAASGIEPDSTGTDATGKTPGGPESVQVGTAGSQGTTSAEAPSGAVRLDDLSPGGKK